MKNPYSDPGHHPSEVIFGRRPLLVFTIVFLASLVLIPLARHLGEFGKEKEARWFPVVEFWNFRSEKTSNLLFEKKSQNPAVTREKPNLRDHLQAFEAGVKDSPYRKWNRKSEQTILSTLFGKGNNKVVTGKDGWLYYRTAIDAVTGRGPLDPEPDSVTKDPDRPAWHDALPVISAFADQLKDRGVDLMIVPIPVKPMVETEGLGLSGIIRHPDQEEFYTQLRRKGIAVVDLLPAFTEAKEKGDVYLRQDTHWTATTAKTAARIVAKEVKKYDWYAGVEKSKSPQFEKVSRTGMGDLVGMIDDDSYTSETQTIERVLYPDTGKALENDLLSPVAVLGDSFINIFEEPGLGFGDDADEGLIGAGFASHLAAFLQMRPQVLAINGEGATGVRKLFASQPDNVVRSKKLVIWAIASRDFLLSESAANRAGVRWRDVEFNPESEEIEHTPTDEEQEYLILSGTLSEKSSIEDPEKADYTEAIYSTTFTDLEVHSGEYYDSEAWVFLWAFRDKEYLPTSRLKVGKRYRLKLAPMIKLPEISRKTQLDELTRFDIDRLFALEATEE